MSSDDSARQQGPKQRFASPSFVTRRCNRCGLNITMHGGGFGFCPGQGRRWVGRCCYSKPIVAADHSDSTTTKD